MNRVFLLLLTLFFLAGAYAQTVTVAIAEPFTTFDPAGTNRVLVVGVFPNLYDSLIRKDEDGNLTPSLATEWTVEGTTALRLTLRDDVVWHDGEPFTAADVRFSIERIKNDPTLVRHSLFAHVTEVEVESDYEVVIHTSRPDPLLPLNLSGSGAEIVPEHYINEVGIAGFVQHPVGTGPYTFVEYRPDDRLVLKRFDGYWRGQAYFEDAVVRIIPENATAVNELITGGIDLMNVFATNVARVKASDLARIVHQPTNRVPLWAFNMTEDSPTANPLVRQAVDYAIDPTVLIEVLENGFGTPTRTRAGTGENFVPEGYFGEYRYDPERARELLAEAGYAPGELTLNLVGAQSARDRVELTAVFLQEVGINTTIDLYEASVFSTQIWNPGAFPHMATVESTNYSWDYGSGLAGLATPGSGHAGATHWVNEAFTDLVTRANQEVDPAARLALLAEATEILVDDLPILYLYNGGAFAGASNRLEYIARSDATTHLFDMQERTP